MALNLSVLIRAINLGFYQNKFHPTYLYRLFVTLILMSIYISY
ncbi:hypothetical protein UNSW2_118 [Campylobacter concisus UNSW2]|uniref:Uncharacterized protein n=1 Tax=Campylobacter concisus UNSW2 TaxID=1242965 RepID=U2GWN2_9BACT|nr:hypothetical protein UNSW2_118 [Campylobacter concisus UNSW2]